MWIPETGTVLELAHGRISESLWKLALSKLPEDKWPGRPENEIFESRVNPETRRLYFKRLRTDVTVFSWRIIKEMARKSPKQIIFAVSASGQRVGISEDCIPRHREKKYRYEFSPEPKVGEYPFPDELRIGRFINYAFTINWFEFSVMEGIFEEDQIFPLFPTGHQPEITGGAVSLMGIRKEIEYQKALRVQTH